MTIEKFYETLELLIELDRDLKLQTALDNVNNNLTNLVSAPAQPQHQSGLASALSTLTDAATELAARLSPAQQELISELGGAEYFDPLIAAKVHKSIAENAMTPSVALSLVQKLTSGRQIFMTTVTKTDSGLRDLNVTSSQLEPGTADLAFVIPRNLFSNELGSFAKELSFISRMIQDFNEAVTGKPIAVELEGLSSSVPTVALVAALPVIAVFGKVVNLFLDAWQKVERIRKIRADLQDEGLDGVAIDQLTDRITTTISEVVEESAKLTLSNYEGEETRRNELHNALRQDTKRLFGQIERGLTIQFRVAPTEEVPEEDQAVLKAVGNLSMILKFPTVKHAPILLVSGQILEGEIDFKRGTTKTTTTTTETSVKKAAKKAVKITR